MLPPGGWKDAEKLTSEITSTRFFTSLLGMQQIVENPLAWTERIDGGKLYADAMAEKPRVEAEEKEWQEKYNTPRQPESQETDQATEQTGDLEEQGDGEDGDGQDGDGQSGQNDTWTNRNRPGL